VLCFLSLVVLKFTLYILNKKMKDEAVNSANVFVKKIDGTIIEKWYENSGSNAENYSNFKIIEKVLHCN
uniref:hypothetical protein n=1 Tax=Mycoplasmopsis primatum TaxID=55604 RepID=UPI00055E9485